MKAVIIDDETKNINILQALLTEFCTEVEIVGVATSVELAIPLLSQTNPDIVFLDIEMPRGNAFDLLDKIKPVNFEVIFVTAFNEYSLKAFRYSALDYLLKPVNIEELKQSVFRASQRVGHKRINSQINNLFDNLAENTITSKKIALQENDGSLVFVEMNKIIRLEAKRGYTLVFLCATRFYISSKPMKDYEEMLPKTDFCRIHNSHIINITKVLKYHKGRGGEVEMEDGSRIEVASRRKDEFLARLGDL